MPSGNAKCARGWGTSSSGTISMPQSSVSSDVTLSGRLKHKCSLSLLPDMIPFLQTSIDIPLPGHTFFRSQERYCESPSTVDHACCVSDLMPNTRWPRNSILTIMPGCVRDRLRNPGWIDGVSREMNESNGLIRTQVGPCIEAT